MPAHRSCGTSMGRDHSCSDSCIHIAHHERHWLANSADIAGLADSAGISSAPFSSGGILEMVFWSPNLLTNYARSCSRASICFTACISRPSLDISFNAVNPEHADALRGPPPARRSGVFIMPNGVLTKYFPARQAHAAHTPPLTVNTEVAL
jgi:hypothetical protein